MLKCGYYGTFHKVSPKHLHRYVHEFASGHNMRELDTESIMRSNTDLHNAELCSGLATPPPFVRKGTTPQKPLQVA